MWTATLKNKVEDNGILAVTVEFSNGTKTITETCRSAYITDIKAWVRSRINEFTKAEELNTALVVNAPIDHAEEVVPPPTPTQAEIDGHNWHVDYARLDAAVKLVALGVFTGSEAAITNLRTKVKNNFKNEYLDLI